jgi:hypothetical protein
VRAAEAGAFPMAFCLLQTGVPFRFAMDEEEVRISDLLLSHHGHEVCLGSVLTRFLSVPSVGIYVPPIFSGAAFLLPSIILFLPI